jgi:hypothetical protein
MVCNARETGFEAMKTQMDDHTGCGLGGREYGTSQEIETLQGQNNPSAARLGAGKEFSSPLARRGKFASIIRSCHR